VAVPFFPAILKNVRVRFYIVYNLNAADRERANTALSGFLRSNALTHNVALELPLTEIAQAHTLIERGEIVGNVVLKL
jgi:NADPH:quinone reductase